MSGRHEPPTKRSFYFSLATSTIRFAVIVALVVGGVVLISRAFPDSGTGTLPDGVPTPTVSPSASPSQTPKSPPTAELQGLNVAVLNGTSESGLAASTATKLQERFGVVASQLGNAPSPVTTTTLYYRNEQARVNAQELIDRFFTTFGIDATLAPLEADSNIDRAVRVAIYLGNDYATATEK